MQVFHQYPTTELWVSSLLDVLISLYFFTILAIYTQYEL